MARRNNFTEEEWQEMYWEMLDDLRSEECAVLDDSSSRPTSVRFCGKEIGIVSESKYDERLKWSGYGGYSPRGFRCAPEGVFRSQEHALRVLAEFMTEAKFWPNIYHVNDHGNVTLLSKRGKEIASWV